MLKYITINNDLKTKFYDLNIVIKYTIWWSQFTYQISQYITKYKFDYLKYYTYFGNSLASLFSNSQR